MLKDIKELGATVARDAPNKYSRGRPVLLAKVSNMIQNARKIDVCICTKLSWHAALLPLAVVRAMSDIALAMTVESNLEH